MISEITVCVRPEFEFLAQRTANLVVPEIKSRKNAAPGKIGPAELLKTEVFWQALDKLLLRISVIDIGGGAQYADDYELPGALVHVAHD